MEGNGRLWVGRRSLLFVADARDPVADQLGHAILEQHPGRVLASVLANSEFRVPAFVYASETERLRGIVFGQIQLHVIGSDATIVDGIESDPWATFDVDLTCTLTCGDLDSGSDETTTRGPVAAGGFRWSLVGDEIATPRQEEQRKPTDAVPEIGRSEEDATVVLGPGQVMLEDLYAERRMIDALVCLECEVPNPPERERCRSCTSLLVSGSTELRRVPQPVLGTICLSGGREELLDSDLIVGRRPSYRRLEPFQRAVAHAEHDRSVSRRHIELKLDQWRVTAENLQDAAGTTIVGRNGNRRELVHGQPQALAAGDTIHFGGAWLRFEPES